MAMTETDEGLSREIRKWDLIALLVNTTVGAGIFRLPSDVQRLVGNYSLLVFFLCALVLGLIALCFAEVGSRFSGTGGPYLTIGKGVWELCDGRNFTGRCVTLNNSVADMRTMNIGNRIASLRPLSRQPR